MQVLCARWSILLLTLDRQTIVQPATTQYRTGKSKCIRMPRCRASNRTRNFAWSIGSLHSRMLYDNPSLELTRNKGDSSDIAARELVLHALKSESLTITRPIDIRVNKQCGLGLDSTTILSISSWFSNPPARIGTRAKISIWKKEELRIVSQKTPNKWLAIVMLGKDKPISLIWPVIR